MLPFNFRYLMTSFFLYVVVARGAVLGATSWEYRHWIMDLQEVDVGIRLCDGHSYQ